MTRPALTVHHEAPPNEGKKTAVLVKDTQEAQNLMTYIAGKGVAECWYFDVGNDKYVAWVEKE